MNRKLLAGIFLALTAGLLYFVGSMAYFAYSPFQPGAQEGVVFELKKGLSPNELSQQLQSKGVTSDAKRFLWVGKLSRQWKKIKAGEYSVSAGMSPLEIFGVLTSGISINHPITVREGENMYEVAADLEAKGLAPRERVLKLCRDSAFIAQAGLKTPQPPTLEGYLYPETYYFNKTMTAEDMLRQMVRQFLGTWTAELDARARALGLNRHEVMTLASMIEKETGAPEERPMISSVFHNRLRKRMKLQSDPTTIYGIWERYKGNITRNDLLTYTPYNTYTVPALPAGPIGNPGKDAVRAALFPATSEFLFFVSHNDGTHEFTRSLEDHNRAVHKFQLDPKARVGKSWRDLKKRKPPTSSPAKDS